ncbi:MAG: hypothetical protein JW828_11240 [Sedimentisphaerales bacterium]|nr:hypothetical protein [Sedimentisphaerales bacterium]
MSEDPYIQIAKDFFCLASYSETLRRAGLDSIHAVFSFRKGEALSKSNLAGFRTRYRFQLPDSDTIVYLKRYDHPPKMLQIRNWMAHRTRAATAVYDHRPTVSLTQSGIATPRTVAFGWQWEGLFEKRSFILSQALTDSEALERKLPSCFDDLSPTAQVTERRTFIDSLADWARRFHETGYRHRDFYLAHIFFSQDGSFSLIDLQRAFRPIFLQERFRIKDIAQLHYSASGQIFSCTDRLRFYRRYAGIEKLGPKDRRFLKKIRAKAWRMADHDIRHGRQAPFAS